MKKTVKILIFFSIKTLFKWIVYHCLKDIYRGKGPRSYNRPWVPYESSTTSEEKMWLPKGLPARFLWAQKYLKGGLRRNVSSNVSNIAQACTLPARRIHFYEH